MQARTPTLAAFRRASQRTAASLVAAAWATLGYGLLPFASNMQAWGELEAGGRLTANLTIYLPYFALTPPVSVAVALGLCWRHSLASALLTLTAITIAGFAYWTTLQDFFLEAQPQLRTSAVWCIAVDIAAFLALFAVWLTGPQKQP
ncbi:hypothetical protein [Salinispora oceanensis]|uniref:hypothetical protein n=1 Tax=Salinispora oceanensis TaxID=1050199 RepID=UPI001CC5A8DD|nr:hypothetical protein [Salinispora oceanensis]